MAEFYRATKVEEQDRKFPGLQKFIEDRWEERVTHTEILVMVTELYPGVKLSIQNLSVHYRLRWWLRKDRELEADLQNRARFRALEERAAQDPATRARMIEVFAEDSVLAQRERLAQESPLKLMADLRKSRELAANMEIEKGKLALDNRRLENETAELQRKNRELELKLAEFAGTKEKVKALIGGAEPAEVKDRNELYREIDEIYGVYQPQADPAALPGAVRSGSGEAAGGPVEPANG